MIPVLKPFDVATTCLSYEENVSVSFVVPILHGLKESLQKDSASVELPAVKDFKEMVLSEIERRWDLTSPALTKLLVLSSIMDPRFKLKYIKTERHEEVCDKIIAEMEKVPSDQDRDRDKEDTAAKPTVKKRKTALDVLLGPESEEDNVLSPRDELDKYLAEPLAPHDINPLHWWKEKAPIYYRLSRVACSLLCIPATSVPSERIFSKAGLTITKLRNSLKRTNVDALVFLNKNMHLLKINFD